MIAVEREFLNSVVAPVGDVEAAVGRDGDAPGQLELAFALAMRSEGRDERAAAGEDLYAVVVLVGDVEPVIGVEREAGGAVELAGRAPGLTQWVSRLPSVSKTLMTLRSSSLM